MLAGSTEIQASVHSRKKDSSCLYIHLFHLTRRCFAHRLSQCCALPDTIQCPPRYPIPYDSNSIEYKNISNLPFLRLYMAAELYTAPICTADHNHVSHPWPRFPSAVLLFPFLSRYHLGSFIVSFTHIKTLSATLQAYLLQNLYISKM